MGLGKPDNTIRDLDFKDVPLVRGWHLEIQSIQEAETGLAYEFPFVERPDRSEYFSLTNRSFEDVDGFVGHKFIALILKKVKENPDRKITVLDLGGGVISKAAIDILNHPFLKGKVRVINVDPFAKQLSQSELDKAGVSGEELIIVSEEFGSSGFPDNSVDAVISYQVLNYMTDQHFAESIYEVCRILAPGGEAYIDNDGSIPRQRSVFSGVPTVFPVTYEASRSFYRNFDRLRKQGVCISETYKELEAHQPTILNGGGLSRMIHVGKYNKQRLHSTVMDFDKAWPELGQALGVENSAQN